MKKLLLFLLIILVYATGYGQKYLTLNDSTYEVSSANKYAVLTVTDSMDSNTDTLKVYIYNSYTRKYEPIGVQDLITGDYLSIIVPGNGNTKRYLIFEPYPTRVQVVRVNTVNLTRRTFVWLIFKG